MYVPFGDHAPGKRLEALLLRHSAMRSHQCQQGTNRVHRPLMAREGHCEKNRLFAQHR